MAKVGELIDSGLDLACDIVATHDLRHFIGEKITDATLRLLRETPREDYDQTATS